MITMILGLAVLYLVISVVLTLIVFKKYTVTACLTVSAEHGFTGVTRWVVFVITVVEMILGWPIYTAAFAWTWLTDIVKEKVNKIHDFMKSCVSKTAQVFRK